MTTSKSQVLSWAEQRGIKEGDILYIGLHGIAELIKVSHGRFTRDNSKLVIIDDTDLDSPFLLIKK